LALILAPTIELLARALGLTHSVAVRLVEDIISDGLVKRKPGKDRRDVALQLTAKGRALRARIVTARFDKCHKPYRVTWLLRAGAKPTIFDQFTSNN
jgi:DNA-binding MarR family transcriptional regulator